MTEGRYYFIVLMIFPLAVLCTTYPVVGTVVLSIMGMFYLFLFGRWLTLYARDAIYEHQSFLNEKTRKSEPYKPYPNSPFNSVYKNWRTDRWNLFDQAVEAQKKKNNQQ